MSDLDRINSGSPFDGIRITTPEGREYWSARELMPLLGYEKWERFADAIDRAKIAAHNSGESVVQNFPAAGKVSGRRGPAQADYHLSRYASYLVAMSGDSRKPEVAAALTYFAVKTRQAETTQPAVASSFDVMRQMIDSIEETSRIANEARAIAAKTDARLDAIEGRHDWYSALGYARLNGIQNTSTQFLNRVGRQASSIAKRHDIDPVKVPHQLFGEVNSYPAWVWEIAFTGLEVA